MEEKKRHKSLIAFDSNLELDLSKARWDEWNKNSSQPYLELYGETHPIVCTNIMETLPTHSMNTDPQMPGTLPIYEYYWTIGLSEYLYEKFKKEAVSFVQRVEDKLHHVVDDKLHHDTDDKLHHDKQLNTGATVTLYFPLSGGWRVEEVVATIRYIRPLPHHENLTKKVAEYWEVVAPAISKVSELVEHTSIPVVSTGATLLNTLAKVPITSLPPVDGLSWEVKKITGHMESEIMEGIQWTLPKKLFYILGPRVTGSIAVYFHPACSQQPVPDQQTEAHSDIRQKSNKHILATAEAYDGDKTSAIFGKEAVKLKIEPLSITDWQQANTDLSPHTEPDKGATPYAVKGDLEIKIRTT